MGMSPWATHRAQPEPSWALTTGVDSAVLEGAGVCPNAQLPRVLQDKRTPGWRHSYLCLLGPQPAVNLPCCAHRSSLSFRCLNTTTTPASPAGGKKSPPCRLGAGRCPQQRRGACECPPQSGRSRTSRGAVGRQPVDAGEGVGNRTLMAPCALHPAHIRDDSPCPHC